MQNLNRFESYYFNSLDEAWNFINSSDKFCSNPHPLSMFDVIKEQSNDR